MVRFALLAAFAILQLLQGLAAEELQPEFPRFETRQSRVVLSTSRGYRDVLIAIGDYVVEKQTLIDEIRNVFTDLSAFLYSATNEYGSGVHFEEIRILIPDTWSDNPSYEPRTWESFAAADIQVDHPPNSLPNENQPATNKPTHCGSPGLYIHVTPDYITNDIAARPYGDRNRTLTHEWAHYRWGVFDEYPTEGYPHFYAGENGQPEATKCVSAIRGSSRSNVNGEQCTLDAYMIPDETCRFFEDYRQTGTYEGSLMYKQFLPKMRTFCDNSSHTSNPAITHNAMAPNEQNNLCNSKSIWEVLREHSDFREAVPSNQPRNLAPSFRLIKRRESRSPVVIVLDRSGSMKGQKLHIVRQASYNLITRVLNDGQKFGAVAFSSTAETVIEPQVINSGNREQLTSQLPTTASGGTSLKEGLLEAIRALERLGDYTGAEMIALTDGATDKKESEVTNSQLAGIKVHTIAIGPQAEPNLEQLATRTGGRTFEHSDQSAALFNIFTELAVQDDSGTLTILSEPFNVTVNTVRRFSVDSFSAGELTILVGFPIATSPSYEVQVVKPNGDVISSTNARSPDSFRLVEDFDLVQIDTESTAGDWEIRVTPLPSAVPTTLMGTMYVETKRRVQLGSDGRAIRPTTPIVADVQWALASMEPSQIQTVTVTVHKGYTPISGAEVIVLVVSESQVTPVHLLAYDDGIGADVKPNDGVYSAFFTQFSGSGRYSLQVTVRGTAGVTKLLEGARVGQGLAAYDTSLLPEFRPTPVDTGSFERSIEGNSFQCMGAACQGDRDLYTPYRIRDLRAVRGDDMTAILTFTATGNDLDYGRADYYEIHIFDGTNQMLLSPETQMLRSIPGKMRGNESTPAYVSLGNLSSPMESRGKEVFHVRLPREGDFSYIFRVVAVDDDDKRSQPSNLASVTAMPAAVTTAESGTPNPAVVSTSLTPGSGSILPIFIGTLLAFLLLVALVMVAFSLLKRRKSERDEGDEETKVGTVEREHAPADDLPHVRGSSGSDEVSNAYQLTKAFRNDAENVLLAGMVHSGNARGVDNPALDWNECYGSASNAVDDPRQNGGESDSDDDDAPDYQNTPNPHGFGGQSLDFAETGLSPSIEPPVIPRRAGPTYKEAIMPPKPSVTPRQVRDQPKPVPRSRTVETAEATIHDGSSIGDPSHTEGMRDPSIYPFVSVGSGFTDEKNTAYQFTRAAELGSEEAVHHAEKVYFPPPLQQPTATQQQPTATLEEDSSSDDDDDDYEPVANPNSSGNQIMGMMQTHLQAGGPAIPVKKNKEGRTAKQALQPPKLVPKETKQPLTGSGGRSGNNNFLGELTNVLARPSVASRSLESSGDNSPAFAEEPSSVSPTGLSSVDDHVYDDAPRSMLPFGMADDEDDDSDKDDYEFVNDPNNSMALGLDRP